RLDGQRAPFEQELPAPGEHLVDLVHALVRVQRVLLPGLECVQPDQDALGREERALAHPVGPEDGVLLGTDRAGMLERLRISHRTSSLGPRRLAGAGRRYTPRAMAKSLDDLV